MIYLREQFPYIDENLKMYPNLVKHWAEDESGVRYLIRQKETGDKYAEAIDISPCRFTYEITNEKEEDGTEDL